MLTENVSYFYDFSIDNRKDVRYNTNIHTEYMFGIFVWNICIARIIYNMYFRNLFVLDFMRRFFVSCAQIFEAYAVRTLMKLGCDWRKISHKSKCRKDSESTSIKYGGVFYARDEYQNNCTDL